MSTMQTPQDEIAAIQATLALHAEDLELIKQQLPEIAGAVRQAIEQATAEFVAAHEDIERELQAIRERQEAQALAQAHTAREIAGIKDEIAGAKDEITSIKETLTALVIRTDVVVARIDEVVDRTDVVVARIDEVVDRTDVVVVHIAELKASTDAMSRTLTETSSRVGNLTGKPI